MQYSGRLRRSARLESVRAHHFGSLACKPAAGNPSGIGLGMARCLARQGVNIVLNGFGDTEGPKAHVAAMGVEVGYHGADMSKAAEIEALVAYAAERFSGVDVLANNAGIQQGAKVEDCPVDR
jgi:3-hydroxybutyrate dehydrogenase